MMLSTLTNWRVFLINDFFNRNLNMKHLLLLITFALSFHFTYSQKVYVENVASRADVKVYIETVASRADLIVYRENVSSRASGNNGLWFYENVVSRADKKVFYVNVASRADLKIFFTDVKSRAGWRNKDKKHIML